ncbi:hypothetical protein AVEN_58167-1, partial [Araneus ventricosus]
ILDTAFCFNSSEFPPLSSAPTVAVSAWPQPPSLRTVSQSKQEPTKSGYHPKQECSRLVSRPAQEPARPVSRPAQEPARPVSLTAQEPARPVSPPKQSFTHLPSLPWAVLFSVIDKIQFRVPVFVPVFPVPLAVSMSVPAPFSVPVSVPPPLSVPVSVPPPLSVPETLHPILSSSIFSSHLSSVFSSVFLAPGLFLCLAPVCLFLTPLVPSLLLSSSAVPALSVPVSVPAPLSVPVSVLHPLQFQAHLALLSVPVSVPPPLSVSVSVPPPLSVPVSDPPLPTSYASQRRSEARIMEVGTNKLPNISKIKVMSEAIPTSNKFAVLSIYCDESGVTNGGGPQNCPYSKKCDYCCKTYSTPSSFSNHIKKFKCPQPVRNSCPKFCKVCSKTYSSKSSFSNHLKKCRLSKNPVILSFHGKSCNSVLETGNACLAESVVKPTIDLENVGGTNSRSSFSDDLNKFKCAETVMSIYPRLCKICLKSYSSKSSFCNHSKRCRKSNVQTALSLPEENSDSVLEVNNGSCVELIVNSVVDVETIQDVHSLNNPQFVYNKHGNFPKKCFKCGEFYNNDKSFRKHEESCSSIKKELFFCIESDCNQVYENLWHLNKHLDTVH